VCAAIHPSGTPASANCGRSGVARTVEKEPKEQRAGFAERSNASIAPDVTQMSVYTQTDIFSLQDDSVIEGAIRRLLGNILSLKLTSNGMRQFPSAADFQDFERLSAQA